MKERRQKAIFLITLIIILGFVLLTPRIPDILYNGNLILPAGFLLVFLGLGYNILKITKVNDERAIQEGFESFKQKKITRQLGFSKVIEYENAKSLGFQNNHIKSKVNAAGYKSVEEMKLNWLLEHSQVKKLLHKLEIYDIKQICNSFKSLLELIDVSKNIKRIGKEIEHTHQSVIKSYKLQNEIMTEAMKTKENPFLEIENSEFQNLYQQTQRDYDEINNLICYKDNIWKTMKELLKPVKPLLTLIELTQDGYPIDLGRMAKVMQCSENQAEQLIRNILKDNRSIGTYDNETQIYTKGKDISKVLKQIKNIIP
ncbi:MAG: hypothetical protein ACC656_15480 [Candidatus Heimdallarchaeota archaeon]